MYINTYEQHDPEQGRIQDFKLGGGGGAHLKKLLRAEGGANIFGVFRVKTRFYATKSYFSNFRGGARNIWGISCEKSRFYAKKKIIFFPILGGARAGCAPPPPPPPLP